MQNWCVLFLFFVVLLFFKANKDTICARFIKKKAYKKSLNTRLFNFSFGLSNVTKNVISIRPHSRGNLRLLGSLTRFLR
jgi:hypothetical protein